MLDLLSDTIGDHNPLHIVPERQCEHKSTLYIIFVLNYVYFSSFESIPTIVTAFSFIKDDVQ